MLTDILQWKHFQHCLMGHLLLCRNSPGPPGFLIHGAIFEHFTAFKAVWETRVRDRIITCIFPIDHKCFKNQPGDEDSQVSRMQSAQFCFCEAPGDAA